ncbi:hypothetical protein ACJX0J_022377, partial [Zea mays]
TCDQYKFINGTRNAAFHHGQIGAYCDPNLPARKMSWGGGGGFVVDLEMVVEEKDFVAALFAGSTDRWIQGQYIAFLAPLVPAVPSLSFVFPMFLVNLQQVDMLPAFIYITLAY